MSSNDELYNEQLDSINLDIADEENDDDLQFKPEEFHQAVIWGTDWTTETINIQLVKGNIDLNPNFQRRDAWSDKEKSKLIESLMLGFPVPPIVLAESKTKRNSYIVIDGKQRLLSIRRFYSSTLPEIPQQSPLTTFDQLKLKGLQILDFLNNKAYNEVKSTHEDYIDVLDNQPIRTVIIKNWPNDEFLYSVFLRLNTGSKQLSPQELRQALIPGEFLSYLENITGESEIIQKMLKNEKADARMRDVELVLRYYAHKNFLQNFKGNLKIFLDETCKKLNTQWSVSSYKKQYLEQFSELEKAIEFSSSLMSVDYPFTRYVMGKPSKLFNRAIFEIFTFYFSIPEIRKEVKPCAEQFVNEFIRLNSQTDFINSVSDTTKEVKRVHTRYKMFLELLLKLPISCGTKLPQVNLEDGKITLDYVRKA